MLIIPVKDGESIDRALKRYKRKYDRTKVVRELRDRQQFTKPSVIKRQQKGRAIYKQQQISKEEA
ncbi:MAG: 30S ribosomal protein S21 [Flavobacteriaceae bacterium]|nr:30S ribosomal protein S21 [Flavobacteriaceae bacterium]